ncbi:MAG: tRNA 2-thiocytidine biosynthesis protein TtcA [Clostridia bacterium]|nr:tRNA 2-thiocytidine biosynthesis protein TtcA [Clostridia bacterium]
MQKILSTMRRAIQDYNMLDTGDKIAVGVSGGKDSLVLLAALTAFRRFSEKPFEVMGITINMGFEGVDYSPVARFCEKIGVDYIVKNTDIAEILFDVRKEKNPCSLCSRMRRGALNDLAKENGCNKVALGHNNEDVLETFFLSLFYEGRLNSFSPFTYLSRREISVIRPLIYAAESDIRGYARRAELPVVKNPCPMDGVSKRQDMKDFINEKTKLDRHFKSRMMNAIQTGLDDWKIGGQQNES